MFILRYFTTEIKAKRDRFFLFIDIDSLFPPLLLESQISVTLYDF